MKKIVIAILTLSVMLGTVACGEKTDSTAEVENVNVEIEEENIVQVLDDMGTPAPIYDMGKLAGSSDSSNTSKSNYTNENYPAPITLSTKNIKEYEKEQQITTTVTQSTQPSTSTQTYFIGDNAQLIISNNSVALINGGNIDNAVEIVNFINSLKITKLDYVIETKPTDTNISGFKTIVSYLNVTTFIMPTATTEIYKNLESTLQSKKITITAPVKGSKYLFGNSAIEIIDDNYNFKIG